MQIDSALLPSLIKAAADTIEKNADEITELDQAIGDGDHVINLQRGLDALLLQSNEISQLEWAAAWQKIGMTLLSTMGGASGSLFGTLFISMSKSASNQSLNLQSFADIYTQGVQAVKSRGKADVGEKTMLDVLIPVADSLRQDAADVSPLPKVYENIIRVAESGVESTRDMLATKGRASFLGERTRGHIDAGAKTSQLMICAITCVLADSTSPA